MTSKAKKITGWILSGVIGLMLFASAIDKIIGSDHALKMGTSFGLSAGTYAFLGCIEFLSVLVFLFPRSGVLGALLLSSYLGGAIATHLQHQQNIFFPMAIEAAVWITAIIRFPELGWRIGRLKSLSESTG